MSQSRVRKAPNGSENCRSRASAVKASGDNAPYNRPKEQNQRSRSKNKIPKSIRYDLENALVGLCDVWFEDIKPHLVRNKIKLHVDGTRVGPASGDYGCLPAGAPGCSHLDPGAASDVRAFQLRHLHLVQPAIVSSVGYCLTQRTASRAQCLRPPAPPHRPAQALPPPLSLLISPTTHDLMCQNKFSNKRKSTPHHRRQVCSPPEPHSNWRVARPCRAYNFPMPITSTKTKTRKNQANWPEPVRPPQENYFIPFLKSNPHVKTCNISTPPDQQGSVTRNKTKKNKVETERSRNSNNETSSVALRNKTIAQQNNQTMYRPLVHIYRPAMPQKTHVLSQQRISKTEIELLNHRTETPLNESSPWVAQLISKHTSSGSRAAPLTNRVTSPSNRPSSSLKRITSPINRPTAPLNMPILSINRPASPTNWPTSSPNRSKSPRNRPKTPPKMLTPPQNRPAPQLNRLSFPLNEPTCSRNRPTFLPNRPSSPSNRHTSPSNRTSPSNKPIFPLLISPPNESTVLPDRPRPSRNKPISSLNRPVFPVNTPPESVEPQVRYPCSQIKPGSSCGRSRGTTAFYPSRSNNQERLSRTQERDKKQRSRVGNANTESSSLFDSGLINIIAEKNDKRLRLLYKSPDRDDSCHSFMNLYSSSFIKRKVTRTKKIAWR